MDDWDYMLPGLFFDWDGKPISVKEWTRIREEHLHVAEQTLKQGRQVAYVSTVWLGIDHAFGMGPPLLFETMVFPERGWQEWADFQERYTTSDQALAGHKLVVMNMRLGLSPAELMGDR